MRRIHEPERPIAEPAGQEVVTPVRDHRRPARHKDPTDLVQGHSRIGPIVERAGGDDYLEAVRGEWKTAHITLDEPSTVGQLCTCRCQHCRSEIESDQVRLRPTARA